MADTTTTDEYPVIPNRKERRRVAAAHARLYKPSQQQDAFFATALDGKIHVVRKGAVKTICGRQGVTLDPSVNLHKNRCATCAKALA